MIKKKSSFGRTCKVVFGCVVAILFLSSSRAFSQEMGLLGSAATSELMKEVKSLLKNDRPRELIPYLREIIVRMGTSSDSDSMKARSFCMYQIAVCQLQLNQTIEALVSFDEFVQEFPQDPNASKAVVRIAEIHAMNQDWPAVESYALELDMNSALEPSLRLIVSKLLSGALFQQEKWAEAAHPLLKVFQASEVQKDKSRAAAMLATCYAKMDDFESLSRFLVLGGDAAQQSGMLNVALIETADKKMKENAFQQALYLYRMILMKDELTVLHEKQIAELEIFLAKPFVRKVGSTRSAYEEARRAKERESVAKKIEMKKLQDLPAYDMDIALRIAQCYGGLQRDIPAHTLYQHLIRTFPAHELVEDARINSFSIMLRMQKWDEAMSEGAEYMALYPTGKFAEETSLNLMQVFMQHGRMKDASELGLSTLEHHPNHRFIDRVKHLLGYIYFQKMDYKEALSTFSEVKKGWPKSETRESCDYWISMCRLFLAEYELAVWAFEEYLGNPDYQRFVEDASYRFGIAQYGFGDFESSEGTFLRFIKQYSDSSLVSEAYSMLGDLRGAEGDLDVALSFYKKGYDTAINIAQIDYALFQSATVYELESRNDEIIAMMKRYLAEWGDESNFASAAFWIGKSHKNNGHYQLALRTYIDAVIQFGDTLDNMDVDEILSELIDEQGSVEGVSHLDFVQQQIEVHLVDAKKNGKSVLALRLETLLVYTTTGSAREKHVDVVLSVEDYGIASPISMFLIATTAMERENNLLVHEMFNRCLSDFEDSGFLLPLMNFELQVRLKEEALTDAIKLAEEITDRFGYVQEVGLTRKLKADAHRLLLEYDDAVKTYNELFAVRDWRGPLLPEALYWIGYCKAEQGDLEEACAFFQRVYVLYERYVEWTAKAYEGSLNCLQMMGGKKEDVIKTCREMLSKQEIASTPEGKRARTLLNKLDPTGENQ